MNNPRLDDWLVTSGHYPSRSRARDAILRGCVYIEGLVAKPSRHVTNGLAIIIDDPAKDKVSRAALKLEAALEATGISPEGKIALDLGASTGGFCQVLLDHGAARVFAVDVGHDQLDARILGHPKLVNLERINARYLTHRQIENSSPEIIASDVGFISLKLALPPALDFALPGADGIFLVKPQFEVGRDMLGKGGVVRDPNAAEEAAEDLRQWLDNQPDWHATELLSSPISGGDGNREYLLIGKKDV